MRVQKYGRAWECLGGSREVLRPEGVWEGLGRSGRVLEGPGGSGRVWEDLGGSRRVREVREGPGGSKKV